MTKEELIVTASYSQHFQHPTRVIPLSALNMFLDSNVVIPKGKIEYNILNTGWIKSHTSDIELRIKPSEPVYEWQWYYFKDTNVYIYMQNNIDGFKQYFTELEVPDYCIRFVETKRERK